MIEHEVESENDLDVPPRAARLLLATAEDLLCHLESARCHGHELGIDVSAIETLIRSTQDLRKSHADRAHHRIEPRRRPGKERLWTENDDRCQYMLCLDECGTYWFEPPGHAFPVFCLFGVVIERGQYEFVDSSWREWKSEWLGSSNVIFHEPELRRWQGNFYTIPAERRSALVTALDELVASLPIEVIAAVIHKDEFRDKYPSAHVDPFLPKNQYLMSLDFVIERFAHFLFHRGKDAWGRIFAESREKHEDARTQYEYVRLQIEGTQFMADRTFQYHLGSAIKFLRKSENQGGLQIADLLARSCAEKILHPDTIPTRWNIVEQKLYDGCKGEPDKYGLKVFPIHSRNWVFGKAEGDAVASPSAD